MAWVRHSKRASASGIVGHPSQVSPSIPCLLSAEAGATITLENTGDAPHTFTVAETDVDFEVDAGMSVEASLTGVEPGTYAVTCTLHPQMEATLTVA